MSVVKELSSNLVPRAPLSLLWLEYVPTPQEEWTHHQAKNGILLQSQTLIEHMPCLLSHSVFTASLFVLIYKGAKLV